MITKLKNNLTGKIFLITCLLLTSVSALTYGLIARLMPLTYTAVREHLLQSQGDRLAAQLAESTLDDCGPLLSQFSFNYGVRVSIGDSLGNAVGGTDFSDIMPAEDTGPWETATVQSGTAINVSIPGNEGNDLVYCTAYEFSFQDSPETYKLFVLSNARTVNQAEMALSRIWPWLAAAILLMSIMGSVFYARFIVRLKVANTALQQDIQRQIQLEQAQLEFFSAVSHELKTPITILKGQLGGMLDRVGVYADRDKYLAHNLAVVQQMENLVQELLTISRMEKDEEPAQAPVELTSLVLDCLQDYDGLFHQKRQKLIVHLPSKAWIQGEPPLLKKALGNLLSNAALYSPEGVPIHIAVQKIDNQVIFTVENEGSYLDPASLPHLFEAFFRGDPSRNRQTGGSGLGLYLVQKIAARHGGVCQIQNSEKGVIAALRFPNSTQNTHEA